MPSASLLYAHVMSYFLCTTEPLTHTGTHFPVGANPYSVRNVHLSLTAGARVPRVINHSYRVEISASGAELREGHT